MTMHASADPAARSPAERIDHVAQALRANNIEAIVVDTGAEARRRILELIPEGAEVHTAVSKTLEDIGLFAELHESGRFDALRPRYMKMDRATQGREIRKLVSAPDFMLGSVHAVTEDGWLYNVDATGNRVGAMFIGPKKVIVVAGVNKIVKTIEDAEKRVKEWVAPQNAKRLNKKTPCVETGVCSDCSSPDRICNIDVTLRKKPARTDVAVILVGEYLGL